MKIAIFMPRIVGGGSERFATVLANGLSARGHDVRLLTGPPKKGEFFLSNEVKRFILYKKISLLKDAKTLHNYLKTNQIDVCVAVGVYPNLVAALANIHLKSFIILSERNAPKQDYLSLRIRILRKFLYWRGDAFVFQTPDAKAFYSKSIQKRGVVIPNPLLENLPIRIKNTRHEIVAVGRLMPQKNYPLLLAAFAMVEKKHPDYILRIFGRGPLEEKLKSYAKSLDIANKVIFEGFSLNVHDKIKESEIYVLSSDFEGLPNALMEAMAMGLPVVSTDCPCGGPKMIIENETNGVLVPVGNKELMASSICRFIEDADFRENCANEAFKVRERFCVENILNQWEDVFSKDVNKNRTVN